MKIKEIMTTPVIWVSPETKVKDIIGLLIRHRISSVPVADRQMRLVGIVSQADLFLKEKWVPFSMVKALALFNKWAAPHELEMPHPELDRRTASDVMTQTVYSADAEDELADVARMMVRNDIKRVPVVSSGRVVGMLTRHDLIRWIATRLRSEPGTA